MIASAQRTALGKAISAGNAPGLNDAASAMVLADAGWAENHRLAANARLVSYGIAAIEPGMFGLGPVPAVRQALARAGVRGAFACGRRRGFPFGLEARDGCVA